MSLFVLFYKAHVAYIVLTYSNQDGLVESDIVNFLKECIAIRNLFANTIRRLKYLGMFYVILLVNNKTADLNYDAILNT